MIWVAVVSNFGQSEVRIAWSHVAHACRISILIWFWRLQVAFLLIFWKYVLTLKKKIVCFFHRGNKQICIVCKWINQNLIDDVRCSPEYFWPKWGTYCMKPSCICMQDQQSHLILKITSGLFFWYFQNMCWHCWKKLLSSFTGSSSKKMHCLQTNHPEFEW